jgi:hypothetical protein
MYTHQQRLDILLQSIVIEALEGLGVVELALVRVAGSGVLAEDVKPQLVGPPVAVLQVVSASGATRVHSRCGHTLVPPAAVLATRIGHFAGSSPMLPILIEMGIMCDGMGESVIRTRKKRRDS